MSFSTSLRVLLSLVLIQLPCFANGCLRWDEHHKDDFYSEQVEIVFRALYTTINQIGSMASAVQNRCVRSHLIETVSLMCRPHLPVLSCIGFSIDRLKLVCSGLNY
jgi:hypothetical protein